MRMNMFRSKQTLLVPVLTGLCDWIYLARYCIESVRVRRSFKQKQVSALVQKVAECSSKIHTDQVIDSPVSSAYFVI